MPPIGKTGSYATTTDIQDPLLGVLQNVEEQGLKYRAKKRLEDATKKAEEEKQLKEDVEWDGKFDPTIVGNSKIDDPMLSMSFKAKEEVGQIRRQLKSPNLPYQEKVRLNSRLNKISQSFDIANQTPKIILEKAKEFAENIDKYDTDTINLVEGISRQLEAGKYEAYYDENGTARIKIFNTDETGKPIGILKETTLGDLANEYQPDFKSKFDDILKKEVENTAIQESVVQNGFTTITNKKVDENVKKQNSEAFGNLIASIPEERKHISRKFGVDINDKEAIAKKAAQVYINALDSTYEKDIDQAGILASQKEARAVKKEKEEETPIISDGTITVKEGEVPGTGVVIPRGSKTFAVKNVKKTLGTGKTESLKEVRLKPDGNLVYVVEETYEGETIKKTVPNQKGKDKLNKINPTTKKQYTVEELSYDEIEDVTTSNKKPTFKAYDSSERANDTDSFSILLMNPETGEYFKGTNDAKKYFAKKGEKLSTGKSKPAIQFDAEGNIIQ